MDISQTHIDKENEIVSTAAYMHEGPFHEIDISPGDGLADMNPVEKCLSLANHCAALFLVKSADYGQLLQKVPLLMKETSKKLKNAVFITINRTLPSKK